jgi:hypothetical protein
MLQSMAISRKFALGTILGAVLLIAAWVGIARFMAWQSAVEAVECGHNLRMIDSAKIQWAFEQHRNFKDTPTWEDLMPYLHGRIPKCPSGGTYALGPICKRPTCTVPGHVEGAGRGWESPPPALVRVEDESSQRLAGAHVTIVDASEGSAWTETDSNGVGSLLFPPNHGLWTTWLKIVYVSKEGYDTSPNLLRSGWRFGDVVHLRRGTNTALPEDVAILLQRHTPAYRYKERGGFNKEQQILGAVITEANALARELGLAERQSITRWDVNAWEFMPDGLTMWSNNMSVSIKTTNYAYSFGLLNKVLTIDQIHAQPQPEAQVKNDWPKGRLDTNAAIQAALEILSKINMDTNALIRECAVEASSPSQRDARFAPIYRVRWLRSGKEVASVEFLEPDGSVRHLDVQETKYSLRQPLTTTNALEELIEVGASNRLWRKMGL